MNILYFKLHDFLDSDVTEIMFSTLKAAKKLSKFQLENILRSKLRYCANKAEISSGYQACVLTSSLKAISCIQVLTRLMTSNQNAAAYDKKLEGEVKIVDIVEFIFK